MTSPDTRIITKASFNNTPISDQGLGSLQDTETVGRVKEFAARFFGITKDDRVKITVDNQTDTITVRILDPATGHPTAEAPRVLQKINGQWTNLGDKNVSKEQELISAGADYILTKVHNAFLQSQAPQSTGQGSSGQGPTINLFYPGSQRGGMAHMGTDLGSGAAQYIQQLQTELARLQEQLEGLDDNNGEVASTKTRIDEIRRELEQLAKPQPTHHQNSTVDNDRT